MQKPVLRPAEILLPEENTDLGLWAVLACDQYTSQPEYWQAVEKRVGQAPSTYHMILPEVYLEQPDVEQRIKKIHNRMRQYSQNVLTRKISGFLYVERCVGNGPPRQGLVGCVDLEDYSYQAGALPRIRPSENTVVERIPPRLAVRRGAALESPHILMLADDPEKAIIEPLAEKTGRLALVYEQELMLEGGLIRGWAVTEPEDIVSIEQCLAKLDDAAAFRGRYGSGDRPAFALAVGDGNHSLATAKAYWEEIKPGLPEAERENHPARYCLVELENVQSPAIEIEPIHRVVFGAEAAGLLRAAAQFAAANGAELLPGGKGEQQFAGVTAAAEQRLGVNGSPWPLAVGTLEAFLSEYLENNPSVRVDYVHGEKAVRALAAKGAVGIILPPFEKSDLFRGVALGGVLPKKTFSMGHANEKRYYLECRRIEL